MYVHTAVTLISFIHIQDLARVQAARDNRIAYLEKRLPEVEKLAKTENELKRKWQELIDARSEELLDLKRKILIHERRERMLELLLKDDNALSEMDLLKAEFILLLISVDFDHEVEDVFGSGKRMFRSFREFREADWL